MTTVYPLVVGKFLQGDIDVITDTIRAEMLDGYTYDATHEFLADVDAGTRFFDPEIVSVTSVTANGEVLYDPLVFADVLTGNTVGALLIYKWTGSDATSPLICCLDRRADTVPMAVDTNDGPVSFAGPRLFKL